MATVRCPQCGTEFEKGSVEFCPNPNCGYPVAFLDDAPEVPEPPRMERRPGEGSMQPPAPPLQAPPPPPRPPMNKRPLIIAAVAVAVVAIVVVAFLLLKGGGGEKKATKGSPTPPTKTSTGPKRSPNGPSPSPTPKPRPPKGIQLPWQTAPPQGDLRGVGDQQINALIGLKGGASGGAFVAGGSVIAEGENDAAVWVSTDPDHQTWRIVTGQEDELGGPGDQQINGITQAGDTMVAVGSDGSDAGVWISPKSPASLSWRKVTASADALGGAGQQSMNRVTGTKGLGLIAVGFTTAPDGSQDAAVWRSSDGGESWAIVPDPDGVFGGPGDQEIKRIQTIAGVTLSLVAAGFDTSPGGDRDAAVWTSTNGTDWTQVEAPDLGGDGDQAIDDLQLFQQGNELVAVGVDTSGAGDADGAVWTSPNGTEWTQVASDALGGAGEQHITRLVTPESFDETGVPNLVAGGFEVNPGGDQNAAIWYSQDGTRWTRERSSADLLGGAGDQQINSLSPAGSSLIAVGFDASGGQDRDAQVWTALAKPPAG